MANGSKSDIWSLAITIFEIITIVPVWITQKCLIHGKPYSPRSGMLAFADRDLKKVIGRQQKLGYLMKCLIDEEFS
jgi:hypothetical protein